ncbi:uncharacterized protein LOC121973153 [Zingiber officinale]|uniref:Uncharacterized protein n=1 Tax=Zingiber officinale TaxID=94328 RepID=A0A8J5H1L5_ZINOF|nr:uncharacterized protein LOC121973153 [Zingiber officinale]KAG6513614.1 hypothetical protein ZIOFF_023946 [Zingiber officinale]
MHDSIGAASHRYLCEVRPQGFSSHPHGTGMAAAASSAIRPVSILLPLPPSSLTSTLRSFPGLLRPLPRLLPPPRSLRSSLCPPRRFSPVVFVAAAQSNLFKVIQTAWRIGRDVTDAGANLVPDAVPRPVARIGVAIAAISVALFVLKSFLSTVFFVLAVMGLVYFGFVALNADEVSNNKESTPSSEDQSLEEARRIMEKYK